DVAFFRTNAIAEIRAGILVCLAAAVPVSFIRIDGKACRILVVIKLHGIEHEELCFRTEVSGVRETRKLQITFSAQCDRTRVKGVTFFSDRVDGVADEAERWLFSEGIHPEARGVGNE